MSVKLSVPASQQVKQSVGVPVVANGDIRSESDVVCVHQATGVNGTVFVFVYLLLRCSFVSDLLPTHQSFETRVGYLRPIFM